MIKDFFYKIFRVLEIRSKKGELHFRRWRLVELPTWRVFIYEIYRKDEDVHMHNHPWNFKSLILWGGYMEKTPWGDNAVRPWTWSVKTKSDFHQVTDLPQGMSVSLFIATGEYSEWGFKTEDGFVEKDEYRELKRAGYWNKRVVN